MNRKKICSSSEFTNFTFKCTSCNYPFSLNLEFISIKMIYFKYRVAHYYLCIYPIFIHWIIILNHLVLKILTIIHIIKWKGDSCCTLTFIYFYFGLNVDAPYILKHSFLATCKRVMGNRLNYLQGLYLKTLNLINNI